MFDTCNLGNYELSADDLDAARRHLAESLDIARALNDRDGIVYETFNLGLAEYLGGSPGAAEALFAESLDLARPLRCRVPATHHRPQHAQITHSCAVQPTTAGTGALANMLCEPETWKILLPGPRGTEGLYGTQRFPDPDAG